ncbi:AAA family ATPase [Synechococcus sp. Tobar12-5m-g]|uniref:AAA family ATPase n=1 Tax=unclassified Synechococcus TaxID=2626047 RepID=UPI0020CDEA6E|nr:MULTISPECIES: AAA family ATPase [unclassified Synechococcus]MCP9771169.1 AAA family ATPase [Synechococcus sp. Tobar12-5m-g]MCP9872109.1 AAA family ATPase [Synechococcus sp. Cruz CV-v-12]
MRLIHCRLRNVRVHAELSVTFGPGITLVGGPNETGKSTLVEALHRALFLKATASGEPVQALRSRLHAGHPEVEIGFEAGGERWTVLKRFSGASGTISLSPAGGVQLSGPAAEERLAQLLGFSESLGSKQAQSVLPSRWAHLWVMQGRSGDDLLGRGGASYELPVLLSLLERGGGAALQSALDQAVVARIDAELETTFTGKRGDLRRNSELWNARQTLEQAQRQRLLAADRLADYDAANEELVELAERLERLQTIELPALKSRQDLLRALALQASERKPLSLELQALEAAQKELCELNGAIASGSERLQATLRSQAAAEATITAAATELAAQQANREALESQRQVLERRDQQLQRLITRARCRTDRDRAAAALAEIEAQAAALAELERRHQDLPIANAAHVQRLRELEAAQREAGIRQQALATGVELVRADQPVWLDGEPLQPGEERQLGAVVELRVGAGVAVRISPGGGEALADCRAALAEATARLAKGYAFLGVESVAEAEAQARRREAIEQQLLALRATDRRQERLALGRQLDDCVATLSAIEAELAMVEASEPGEGLDDPQALDPLRSQLRQNLAGLNIAVLAADQQLRSAGAELTIARDSAARQAQAVAALEAELRGKGERQRVLREAHGDPQFLATSLEGLHQRWQRCSAAVEALERQLAPLSDGPIDAQLQDLAEQIQRLELDCQGLISRRGAARQRCDTISSDDPHAALEHGEAVLELAKAAHDALQSRSEAIQLLKQLFNEAQSDLSTRYSEPLAGAISDYLQPLLGGGQSCRMHYDRANGFCGLQLRRGREFYGFGELSGGMKEQLGLALRLSMADVLKAAHGGCLPLLFDDAFTHSDSERIRVIEDMVRTAVARGLQVILFTCNPRAYGWLGAETVQLEAVQTAEIPTSPGAASPAQD